MDSVRYVFNLQTKEVVQEIEYDELGNQLKNTNPDFQPLGYAGGLFDADTRLIRFGARDYDPTVGRWTTKDPIGFAGGNTNLYAYVDGDPMSKFDPEGQQSTSEYKNRKENPSLWKKALKRIRIVGHCCINPNECGKDPAEVNYQFEENNAQQEQVIKEDPLE